VTEPPRGRPLWQIGLRTLFLVMTAAAVWIVYVTNRYATENYEERIAAMRPLARELAVKDVAQVAVVKLEPYWYDENRWAVYLPEGKYRLCLATSEVDESGLAPIVASAPISAGRHELTLEQEPSENGWRVTVDSDGVPALTAEEPKAWYPARGSSGGSEFDMSKQVDADKPVVLFRRRFSQPGTGLGSSTPKGPTDGIIVWIERTADDVEEQTE
jgi:hypothetical protein